MCPYSLHIVLHLTLPMLLTLLSFVIQRMITFLQPRIRCFILVCLNLTLADLILSYEVELHFTICLNVRALSHQTKATAKAKKIREQASKIERIPDKHQRKNLLSLSLSLGVNGPNGVKLILH